MSNTARWIVGIAGTWFVLSLLAESAMTADLSAAFAISVAMGATFVLGKDAAKNLGVLGG